MKRFYFLCITHGESIETDEHGAAKEWLCSHVTGFDGHKIVLTDRLNKQSPVSLEIQSETCQNN